MTGTLAGGQKAAQTNLKKHGKDFYKRIGMKGGTNSHSGGFASQRVGKDGLTGSERAKIAGRKGGKKSKRGAAKHPKQPHYKGNKIQNAHDLYNVLRAYIPTPKED